MIKFVLFDRYKLDSNLIRDKAPKLDQCRYIKKRREAYVTAELSLTLKPYLNHPIDLAIEGVRKVSREKKKKKKKEEENRWIRSSD